MVAGSLERRESGPSRCKVGRTLEGRHQHSTGDSNGVLKSAARNGHRSRKGAQCRDRSGVMLLESAD